MGSDFARPRVGRGAAYADIDNDGDLDLVMTTNGGPAQLFRNDGGSNHSLRVKLWGIQSNRDGIGAIVRVTSAGTPQSLMLRSGSSYMSQSELVLTFGLGSRTKADRVEINWPSGHRDELTNVNADQMITVQEGVGIENSQKYVARR
jgi:hypothetical protein